MQSQCHDIQSNFNSVKKGNAKDRNSGAEGKEMSTATLFYDILKEIVDIEEIAGNTFAIFLEILVLTDD